MALSFQFFVDHFGTVVSLSAQTLSPIDPSIIDGGGAAYLSLLYAATTDNGGCGMELSDTPGGISFSAGPEFTTEFESTGTITIDLEGQTLVLTGISDASEPYSWNPSNQAEILVFVNATLSLVTGASLATVTLNPFTRDSPWSDFVTTTTDSDWSQLNTDLETRDGEWSIIAADLESVDSEWSILSGGLGRTGVGFLATPSAPIDLMAVDQDIGSYAADISWAGQPNHVYLDQVRTRWVSRVDKLSAPAPDKAEADAWAESTNRAVVGDFQYVDTISRSPSPVLLGPVVLRDQMLADPNFADAALWVMARLEVDDQLKDSAPAVGTFSPFYVLAQRDTSQTVLTLFRGSDDVWCVGQMALQPNPSWEVIVTVAGTQDLFAVPFEYHIDADGESIVLVLTTIVAQFGFILHAVNFLSDGNILFRRAWTSIPELPAGPFGPFVITNTDTALIVDPILHCL